MKTTIFCLIAIALLTQGCADAQPQITECITGETYGFWYGLWHGLIAPFAFIGSLIWDDVAVWAVNNNGGWYTFGFLLGIGSTTATAST